MSDLQWADPPKGATVTRLYEVPDFGRPKRGEIADLRWAYDANRINRHKGAVTKALGCWLDENPSFWVLIGSYTKEGEGREVTAGWPAATLYGNGILHAIRKGNIYARSKLAFDGMSVDESLQAALGGENGAQEAVLSLPKLEKDPFGWTEAELNLAVATARDWLYPTEELVAA